MQMRVGQNTKTQAREGRKAEIGMCCLKKRRSARSQQKLEEARKDSALESPEGV